MSALPVDKKRLNQLLKKLNNQEIDKYKETKIE